MAVYRRPVIRADHSRWLTSHLLWGVVLAVFALGVNSVVTGSVAGTLDPAADEVEVPPGSRTQPASLVYGGNTERALQYAAPGAMVVSGRDNYADPAFTAVSDAGGSVLLYLDPVIDNSYGRYHELLLKESVCGPAVDLWPAMPRPSEWGNLVDFRPDSVVQEKLRCVLEAMVSENPDMAGWFVDDVGSRSWFPGITWSDVPADEQLAYREGAIELTRTFREVADEYGLVFLVNGTWTRGSVEGEGGGYPDPGVSGNALADGGVVELHDGRSDFFGPYLCSDQWARQSSVTRGAALNFVITATWEGLQEYVDVGCAAYANRHGDDYTFAPPWSGFSDLGLPIGRRGRTPPG